MKDKSCALHFFVLCTLLIDISLNAMFFAKFNKLPVLLWYFEVSGKGGKIFTCVLRWKAAHGERNIHTLDSFS